METALLQIEVFPEKMPNSDSQKMRVQLKGDPVLVAMGICTAMQARQDIAAAMMAGVLDYMNKNDIDPRTLPDLVKFF